MKEQNWRSRLQRLRVPFGFVFFVVYYVFADPTWTTLAAGSGIALLGLFVRAWASGHLRKNQEFAISGPYAYTRNPLYFGSLILVLGFGVCSANAWLVVASIALFFGIYWPVMQREEEDMQQLFGRQFCECAANVPKFFPRLTPFRSPFQSGQESPGFDRSLYMRYREYRAALGFAGVIAALAAKILWRA